MCDNCGLCCRYVILASDEKMPSDMKLWLNYHKDIRIIKDEQGREFIVIKSKCENLYRHNKKYLCFCHGLPAQPEMCKVAPCLKENKDMMKLIEDFEDVEICEKRN